jgi:hypothetical protein
MALSQQEKDVKDLVDEVKSLYTDRQDLLSPAERNTGWNEGNLTPRQLLYIQELLQSGVFELATAEDVAEAVGYSPESFTNTLSGARQQVLQMDTPQETTGMALPEELQNIPVDGNYSMDEAAIVESLINSGQLSVQQVSDYFGLPATQINQTLTQDFGYTPEQVAQVATTPTIAGVAPDMDYSQADAQAVEQAIRSGQVTVQQVADQFNVPVADVNRVLTTDFGYNPERIQQVSGSANPLAGVAADNDYSMEDARIVENAIRSGQVTIQEVSDYFGLPVAEVNRVLTTDFGYTPDQISSFGGGQVTTQTTDQTTTDRTTTGGATGGTTGGATSGTTALTGGLAGRQVSQVTQPDLFATQQGVGQDISNIMGSQGYTGGTMQNGNIRFNDPNVLGGQVNMPQTGVIGAEAALQGGLSGGLAGLQEGLATGATGLTGAVSSGLQELRRALGQGRQDIQTGYGRAEQGFQPYMQGGEAAQAQLEALTGARGQEAFQQAYQESPYIQFLREQGMRANLAGAAATGGLGGGNVQKELARFGQGLASQGLQQQIQNLQGLAGQGLQATQGAGQYAAGGAGQMAGLQQTQGTQALGAMQNVGNQLANLGLAGGQTAAQMAYGTGQQLASGRTRAGELLAGEISNVGRDVSGLASALGGDISGVYGAQSQNLANLLVQSGMSQADAARIASQQLANIATGASGQVTGLGTSVGQPQQMQGMLGQAGQFAGGLGTAISAFS